MLLTVELGPAENCGECKAEKHRVEEDEAADSGVRVLTKNSQSNKPDGWPPEVQFFRREVCQWHADSTKCGVEKAHEGVVQLLRVSLARFELE